MPLRQDKRRDLKKRGGGWVPRITPQQRLWDRRSVVRLAKPNRSIARRFDLPQYDRGAVAGPG
jgi:hypothetical protein